MFKKLLIYTLLLLTCFFVLLPNNKEVNAKNGESYILIDATRNNHIIEEHNSDKKMPIASLTKVLTAITVLNSNIDIRKTVEVPKSCVGVEGSSIYLQENEEISIENLLYGLMLQSGNDCAETLAITLEGSIENFAKKMNEQAKRINANDSCFKNPHGLQATGHYSTAKDMAIISSYAMKNDTFRKIVGTKRIEIPWANRNYPRVLINKNRLLKELDGATGIKTGYTTVAGRCLIASVKRNERELICVVLNCPPMFEKAVELIERGFKMK